MGRKLLIMGDHEGAGVVPGRYSGPAIPIHDCSTPQQVEHAERQAHADALPENLRRGS
jgi:hypothetical protein